MARTWIKPRWRLVGRVPTVRAQANPGMSRVEVSSYLAGLAPGLSSPAPIHDMDLCGCIAPRSPSHIPVLRSVSWVNSSSAFLPSSTGTLEPRSVDGSYCQLTAPTPSREVRVLHASMLGQCSSCVQIPFEICINFYIHERIVF